MTLSRAKVIALGCLAISISSPAAAAPHSVAKTIPVYSGVVNAATAERFLARIAASEDKIIGLKVAVEKERESDQRYSVLNYDGRLTISAGDPMDAPVELVINGPVGSSLTAQLVDGFYLIKFGGTHAAGAVSWGAIPVNEATVRLSPAVRIVKTPLR